MRQFDWNILFKWVVQLPFLTFVFVDLSFPTILSSICPSISDQVCHLYGSKILTATPGSDGIFGQKLCRTISWSWPSSTLMTTSSVALGSWNSMHPGAHIARGGPRKFGGETDTHRGLFSPRFLLYHNTSMGFFNSKSTISMILSQQLWKIQFPNMQRQII